MDEWFRNLNLPQAIVVCVAIIGVVWLFVA